MKEENKLDINKNWETFKKLLLNTKRPGIEELIKWLDGGDYKYAPASTRYHGNYEGGLLEHSLNVYYECLKQKDLIKLFKLPVDSIVVVALLHDLCKANYYKLDKHNVKVNGTWIEEPYYTVDDFFPIGHAEKSIIVLQQFIKLNEVEIAMIRGHMGGFVTDSYFSPSNLYEKYPEAVILQYADMVATYVLESKEVKENFKTELNIYKGFK